MTTMTAARPRGTTTQHALKAAAPPERALIQRLDALERANEVRKLRADLKRDIKAGRVTLASVIVRGSTDPDLVTMKVWDLLIAAPKFGRVKVNKSLTTCRIAPSKSLGGMSSRQRDELVDLLRRR